MIGSLGVRIWFALLTYWLGSIRQIYSQPNPGSWWDHITSLVNSHNYKRYWKSTHTIRLVSADNTHNSKNKYFPNYVSICQDSTVVPLSAHERVPNCNPATVHISFCHCLYTHGRPPSPSFPWNTVSTRWWKQPVRDALLFGMCDCFGAGATPVAVEIAFARVRVSYFQNVKRCATAIWCEKYVYALCFLALIECCLQGRLVNRL